MKHIDPASLEPDAVAAAFVAADKDVISVTGYVCAADEHAIGIAPVRGSTVFTEYPRESILSAFSEEDSHVVTLLVDAAARVRTVSTGRLSAGCGSCACEGAPRPGGPGVGASLMADPLAGRAAFGPSGAAQRQAAGLAWSCRTPRGVCPIVCYPIVVDGRVVDWWCYCDCTNPIPTQAVAF